MGMLAWIFGIIGGLCAVMGIIIALEVIKAAQVAGLDWMFWLMLSAIMLLIAIAFSVGRSEGLD